MEEFGHRMMDQWTISSFIFYPLHCLYVSIPLNYIDAIIPESARFEPIFGTDA